MILLETGPPDRVRVLGPLTGAALQTLLEMLNTADVLLDLSQVREADVDAVELLARPPADWSDRFALPRWLALRVEVERRSRPAAVAV